MVYLLQVNRPKFSLSTPHHHGIRRPQNLRKHVCIFAIGILTYYYVQVSAEGYVHIADGHSKPWMICDRFDNDFKDETVCKSSSWFDVYLWATSCVCHPSLNVPCSSSTLSIATFVRSWFNVFCLPTCLFNVSTMSGVNRYRIPSS